MALQPNKFGKYKKEEVINAGYEIIEHGFTATQMKEFGIFLVPEERLKKCIGFRCEKNWRGCVPVFDPFDITWEIRET